MIGDIHCFSRMSLEYPEKMVFARLGGHLHKTILEGSAAEKVRHAAIHAFSLCRPQGRYCVLPVREVSETGILLTDGSAVSSCDFARKCKNITHLWCAAVTVGVDITEARDSLESVAERAVYDAVGGETADAAMEFMHRKCCRDLLSRGLNLSERRFSPGYGDMPLELQLFLYNLLKMNEMGITLSDRCFMTPEKSVTAFAGITSIQGSVFYDTK